MAPTRASLKGFLATAKKALVSPPTQRPNPLTLVVGNESADLDSICSALLLAYFRTHTPPHALHIPVSNLPRADLALRPELNAVLGPAGLKPDDLITLTDLPRDGLRPEDTRWLLVDHNVLTGDLAKSFSSRVVGCIDHHEDEGAVPHDFPSDQPRIIEKCGSCMSLVLEHCKFTWDALSNLPCEGEAEGGSSTPAAECDAHLARVALAPILIDTANLTSKDKTTDRDVRAAELAESKLLPGLRTLSSSPSPPSSSSEPYDRQTYHDTLAALKEQIVGLSYRDVLRKDYKRWTEGPLALGVSTVVHGFEYVFARVGDQSREAFLAALKDWAREEEQKLDVVAVMTVSRPGGMFTRELLVWGLNEKGVEAVGRFQKKFGGTLGLETWRGGELDGGGEGEAEWRLCWRQKGVSHSRKQVAPMLREAMRESARL
ncbi:hypothetical protein MYCTH_2310821 [Thermothelomyces thermophilus ATCC 42464]|uniref:DHHA2 domain-containing protein n=1 Tax=Thermothelomyces thermophilus (strain ATCC 42464 / BCRC 31852 / DSM 1799) TaxID=573729 RepID=G2QM60_THET4|nr:uncharacterized protein MYCTH_2310821 [Thermothelomyces thermophilus ATCC 42464]AEO61040.1 hypothetical protein MYCTH_2310821 [Thermothelomyces thermophilus ATCC 42464]